MPLVKMTPRAQKPVDRDDIVVRKALQLNISPLEVFIQAYVSAGNAASSGEQQFYVKYHPGREGARYSIPKVVAAFCSQPMPCCANHACPHPPKPNKRPPVLVRAENGLNLYFCSLQCRNDISNDALAALAESQSNRQRYGDSVFMQISVAMSRAKLVTVPESSIRFMPGQPRKFFDQARLKDLAESMLLTKGDNTDPEVTGQLMPGLIRKIKSDDGFEYELLDGERRLRAVRIAGITMYRALVVELDDESARHVVSVMANFNREGHTPLELSDTVVHFHDELGFPFGRIAQTVGKSEPHVRNMYQLKNLVPAVRKLLDPEYTTQKKRLKVGAAVEIAMLEFSQQLRVANDVIEDGLRIVEVKEMVRSRGSVSSQSGRVVAASERLRWLQAQMRRFPTSISTMLSALSRAPKEGVLELVEQEDIDEWVKTLEAEATKLTEQAAVLKQQRAGAPSVA